MDQTKPNKYQNITTSTLIKTAKGTTNMLCSMFVNSTSSGTIKFWDSTTASGKVINNTITPAAGNYYYLGNVNYDIGLYAQITGTLDVTIHYL